MQSDCIWMLIRKNRIVSMKWGQCMGTLKEKKKCLGPIYKLIIPAFREKLRGWA